MPAAENLGPVVVAVADQGQFLRPRVGHVARDVEQVLAQPDQGGGDPGRVGGAPELQGRQQREGELEQGAAIDREPRAKDADQRMTGFVQGEVGAV